jgi:tellurite resistance protein
MSPENEAIVKSLISVAWADGEFANSERELLSGLLEAFQATEAQASAIRTYAESKRTLEDIPLEELSPDDLRVLINHAVLLTFIDGEQNAAERDFVVRMARYIGLSEEEASHLIASAETRAKRNLRLL